MRKETQITGRNESVKSKAETWAEEKKYFYFLTLFFALQMHGMYIIYLDFSMLGEYSIFFWEEGEIDFEADLINNFFMI